MWPKTTISVSDFIMYVIMKKMCIYVFQLSFSDSKFVFILALCTNVQETKSTLRWGLVVSSPPVTEEIGAMSREIESYQGIGW
jgi:hypothetical protein